jgi:hypothetical protein
MGAKMTGYLSVGRVWSPFCLVLFWAACDPASTDDGFVVRDSSGVRISVNSDSAWAPGEVWQLSSSPDFQLGTSETAPLFEVTSATFLPGNRIAFANSGTSEIIVVDSLGGTLVRFGGAGDGPGEFRSLDRLHRGRGDSLIALDRTLNRASLFSLDGRLGRVITLPQINGARLAQLFPLSDGRFIGSINNRGVVLTSSGLMGHMRDSATHVVISSVGDIEDTVAVVPGDEQYYVVGGSRPELLASMQPLYAHTAAYTVSRTGELYAGLGDDFRIGIFALDGALKQIVSDETVDLALPRTEFDQHVDAYLARAARRGSEPPPGFRYTMPIPDRKPPFSRFLLDEDRNLWVSSFAEFDQDSDVWKVFSVEGQLLGSVAMPEQFRLFAVSGGKVLGRRLTELDVEIVEVYQLLK